MSGRGQHRSRYLAVGLLSTGLLFAGPAIAWAEETITIEFVRHGESVDNANGIIGTTPPGAELTPTGEDQAQAIANVLAPEGPYAGLYASELIRTQETAAPLSEALNNMPVQILPGLNEIDAGIYEGQPVFSPDSMLYLLTPVLWVMGASFMPMPGSSDANGFAFDDRFDAAVQIIYDNSVSGDADNPTSVAFSSEGAIATWTLMNVKNPDFTLILLELLEKGELLPNTGEVVVQGNPEDGWTLISYDGVDVSQTPDLATALLVDVRDLMVVPQLAGVNVYDAFLTGDPTTITEAMQAGFTDISTALAQFPIAVYDDIVNAFSDIFPTAATEVTGFLPGDMSAILTDALLAF